MLKRSDREQSINKSLLGTMQLGELRGNGFRRETAVSELTVTDGQADWQTDKVICRS